MQVQHTVSILVILYERWMKYKYRFLVWKWLLWAMLGPDGTWPRLPVSTIMQKKLWARIELPPRCSNHARKEKAVRKINYAVYPVRKIISGRIPSHGIGK